MGQQAIEIEYARHFLDATGDFTGMASVFVAKEPTGLRWPDTIRANLSLQNEPSLGQEFISRGQ